MLARNTSRWEVLGDWSPRLVLTASVLFVGHTLVRAIEAFTTLPPPVDVFGPTGYVAALLGLLGLAPALKSRTPRITRLATVLSVGMTPAWALIAGWSYGEAAGILPPQETVLPGAFFAITIVATLLLYLLFGVASLRAEGHTRPLGFLLLAPGALLVVLLVGSVLLPIAPEVGGVIIGSGMAFIHGAVGGTLLSGRTKTDHMDPAAEVSPE